MPLLAPTGTVSVPVTGVTQPDKFWVIDNAGLPAVPTTTNPNDGGHVFPVAASPVWDVKNLAIPFTIPAGATPGQSYTLMVFSKSSYLDPTTGTGFDSELCIPITVGGTCTTPAGWGKLNKWPVGVAANGNIMVYRVDYEFFNTTNCIV